MNPSAPSAATAAAVSHQRADRGERYSAEIAVQPGAVARGLLALIRIYQRILSPALPAFFGPTCGCRFSPSCSHYATEAVRTHGAVVGAWLSARRLVKCAPWHRGGFDPVPSRATQPECRRAALTNTFQHSKPA